MEMIARRNVGDEIAVQRPGDHHVRTHRGVDHAGAPDQVEHAAGADGEGRRADRAARPHHLAEGAGVVLRTGGDFQAVPRPVVLGGGGRVQPHRRTGRVAVDAHVARPRGAGAERHVVRHPVRRPFPGVIDHDIHVLRRPVSARVGHRPQDRRQMFRIAAPGVRAHLGPGVQRIGGIFRRVEQRRSPPAETRGLQAVRSRDRFQPLAVRLRPDPAFRILSRPELDTFPRRQQIFVHALHRRTDAHRPSHAGRRDARGHALRPAPERRRGSVPASRTAPVGSCSSP